MCAKAVDICSPNSFGIGLWWVPKNLWHICTCMKSPIMYSPDSKTAFWNDWHRYYRRQWGCNTLVSLPGKNEGLSCSTYILNCGRGKWDELWNRKLFYWLKFCFKITKEVYTRQPWIPDMIIRYVKQISCNGIFTDQNGLNKWGSLLYT